MDSHIGPLLNRLPMCRRLRTGGLYYNYASSVDDDDEEDQLVNSNFKMIVESNSVIHFEENTSKNIVEVYNPS